MPSDQPVLPGDFNKQFLYKVPGEPSSLIVRDTQGRLWQARTTSPDTGHAYFERLDEMPNTVLRVRSAATAKWLLIRFGLQTQPESMTNRQLSPIPKFRPDSGPDDGSTVAPDRSMLSNDVVQRLRKGNLRIQRDQQRDCDVVLSTTNRPLLCLSLSPEQIQAWVPSPYEKQYSLSPVAQRWREALSYLRRVLPRIATQRSSSHAALLLQALKDADQHILVAELRDPKLIWRARPTPIAPAAGYIQVVGWRRPRQGKGA